MLNYPDLQNFYDDSLSDIESISITTGKYRGRWATSKTRHPSMDVVVLLIWFDTNTMISLYIYDKDDINITYMGILIDAYHINNFDGWFKDLMFRVEEFYDEALPDLIYDIIG